LGQLLFLRSGETSALRDLGACVDGGCIDLGGGALLLPLWRLVAFDDWQHLTVCLGGRLCLCLRLLFCALYLHFDRRCHLLTVQHGHHHSRLHFLRKCVAAVVARCKGCLQPLFDDR